MDVHELVEHADLVGELTPGHVVLKGQFGLADDSPALSLHCPALDPGTQQRRACFLRPDCHVEGNITAGSIAIAEGAFFEGTITMGADEVDREAVAFEEKRGATD